MGGLGSGTWIRKKRKTTVEECCSLDANRLASDGALDAGAFGTYAWHERYSKKLLGSIRFSMTSCDDSRLLRIEYRLNKLEVVTHMIRLQTTSPYLGGERLWFTCSCGRRAGRLYILGRKLTCRTCANLTYTSCQISGQEERLTKRLCAS